MTQVMEKAQVAGCESISGSEMIMLAMASREQINEIRTQRLRAEGSRLVRQALMAARSENGGVSVKDLLGQLQLRDAG